MGHPNGDVDRALQQALDILLDTPVVKDPIALVEGDGAGWVVRGRRSRSADADAKATAADGTGERRRLLVWLRALQGALN